MRIQQAGLILSLTAAASACGSILQQPPDGGGDGGIVPCRDLGEAACRSRSDCAVNACTPCSGGGSGFISCYDPTSDPRVLCGPCPPLCAGLDEASCKARPDCRVDACPDC